MKIEKGTTVRGSFQVEGDLVLEGSLEGRVFVTGRLEILATGILTGEATCSGGSILGRVSGIVHASEPVALAPEAVITGRIMAPALDFGGGSAPVADSRPRAAPPPPARHPSRMARPPTVTGDTGQVIVTPGAVLRERS